MCELTTARALLETAYAVVRVIPGAAETAAAVSTAVGGSASAATGSLGSISLDQFEAALTSVLEPVFENLRVLTQDLQQLTEIVAAQSTWSAEFRANPFALNEVDAVAY